MSLFIFLTVLQAIIGAALVGVILIQRSEGGGLGVGGSPAGLMSARGAANFLTRMTTMLAVTFVGLSIVLAALAVGASSAIEIDTSLERGAPANAPVAPINPDPLAGIGGAPAQPAPAAPAAGASPAPADDPLQGAAQ
ncbi:MAG: preprotein translocase subunit SecG [Novosphingobium sp.]|nr:preprotein translocase subunit SecG [Novosphingobium sp.]